MSDNSSLEIADKTVKIVTDTATFCGMNWLVDSDNSKCNHKFWESIRILKIYPLLLGDSTTETCVHNDIIDLLINKWLDNCFVILPKSCKPLEKIIRNTVHAHNFIIENAEKDQLLILYSWRKCLHFLQAHSRTQKYWVQCKENWIISRNNWLFYTQSRLY